MKLNKLTKKFKSTSNLHHFFFPYTSHKLLGPITTKYLDILYFDLFEKLNIQSLVECGAYEASGSIEAIKRGCNAYAIEANPNTFKKITPKSNGKLTSMNIGLSDKPGYLNFYFPKKNNTEISSTFQKKEGTEYDTIKVLTQTLDSVIKKFDIISNPYTLWIDVEGFQKQVLFGAKKILADKNCKLIKIEVEEIEKFKGQSFLSEDIESFLGDYNFVPIFRDFEYDYQYNVLYIKKDLLDQVSNQVKQSIKKSTINSISLIKIVRLIIKKKLIVFEIKSLIIKFFGKKFGNYFASLLGSKSSKAFIQRNNSKN
jgi:FkbM family methyltransferase